MARKRQAARAIEEPAAPPGAEPPRAQEPPPVAPAESEVNSFPRNIRTVDLGGYQIRLNQDQKANEMRIQFGSGQRADKPSDATLDLIRSQRVPEELLTRKEREEGQPVPWFKFRSDPDTGEGSWRMWMRNHSHAARAKAEQVLEAVVQQVAAEREAGRGR